MKTELIRIGNSRGIRIPKPLIEQCGLGPTVDLSIEDDRLIISAKRRPRQGWLEAFRSVQSSGDELLLESVGANTFDREEWRW